MWTGIITAILTTLALGATISKAGEQDNAPYVTMLKASPGALFAGSGTNLTCQITPHRDNLTLRIGIEDRIHDVDLRVFGHKTHRFQVLDVPCGTTSAVCKVTRVTGQSEMAEVRLQVLGCEE